MLSMEENIRPPFSPDDAREIVDEHYGIRSASILALPSTELDRNFQIHASNGEHYVLKIAHSSVCSRVLDLQNKTLHHLSAS